MGVKHKAKMNDEQRSFVVQQLARFEPHYMVQKELKEHFGIEVTFQTIQFYDPKCRAGEKLANRWKKLFEETRKKFVEDTSDIGISHMAVRLRAADRAMRKTEQQGNIPTMLQTIEVAAKEMGGAYTNKQKHEHTFTDEDVLKRMAEGMKRARGQDQPVG